MDLICLKNIGLKVNKGEFVCVIGDVGSGKSSLISSIMGDLQYLDSDFVESFGHCRTSDEQIQARIKEVSNYQYHVAPVKVNETVSLV